MSLTTRINALAERIGLEFNALRQEIATGVAKGSPAGGVLGGTYPNPSFAPNVVFVGKAVLNGLISLSGLDVRGTDNKFGVGSVTTLQDKTAGSVNPPALVVDWSVSADLGEFLFHTYGIQLDADETNRHSVGRFLNFAQLNNNGHKYNWPQVGPFAGSSDTRAQILPYGMTRIQTASGPRNIVWGEEYKKNVPGDATLWQLDGIYLHSYDDAPMITDQPPIDKASYKTNPFTWTDYAIGRCFSETGNARAAEFATLNVNNPSGSVATGTLTRWTCEDTAGFVVVQTISNVPMTFTNSGTDNTVRGVFFGSSARMGFHGTNQDVWVIFAKKGVYVYNAAATERLPDLEFSVGPADILTAFAIGNVATNEFGGFRTVPGGDKIPMTRYTNISWPDTDSSNWWVGHTWYDSVGTTHETNLSVPASIVMKKRARLTVDVGPLPDPAAGAGAARGPEDVNSFRLYLSRGATKPLSPQFYRQTVQPEPLATTLAVTTNPVFTGSGLAPPTSTNFPGVGPAVLQSSAVSEFDNNPKLRLSAAGLAEFEAVKVGGPVDTGLYGRGIDQLYYTLRGQRTMNGGGRRTASGNAGAATLAWSQRFIIISQGRAAHLANSHGYFDIAQPSANTVITGVGGATNKTVTAAGIPMTNWDILWYELPFGSISTTQPGNFKVSNYTSDFVPPNDWIMIAVINGDSGVVQWGDGVRTGIPGVYDITTLVPGSFVSRIVGSVDPQGDIPNYGEDWWAYIPPLYTVPPGARTCHALIHAKGSWGANAACYWTMTHNITGAVILNARVHNHTHYTTPADMALFAIIPVTPGQEFQCRVICNNDPGSATYLWLGTTYFTYTFMS